MGVQCAVFGHVYDETEFEEHRTERPRGEVLICREYQICGRCGNRTEMYRNERLLTPESQGGKPEDDGAEGASDSTAEEANSERERSDPTTKAPANDDGSTAESTPADQPSTDSSSPDEARVEGSIEEARVEGSIEEARVEGSIDETRIEGVPGVRIEDPEDATRTEDGIDSDDRGTVPPEDAASERTSSDSSPADASPTDDAVILSDGAADPGPTASEPGDDGTRTEGDSAPEADPGTPFERDANGGEIRCQACGQAWDGNETSLRDGDMCPDCTRGYVERT